MHFIYDCSLFLFKIVIVIFFIIFVSSIILKISRKKNKNFGILSVSSLNDHYELVKNSIIVQLMDKKTKKLWNKKNKMLKRSTLLTNNNKLIDKDHNIIVVRAQPTLYVIDFKGGIAAHEVKSLREEISSIISVAQKHDEVLLRLESSGGTIHGYGLAAVQLQRLRSRKIFLTISIDKIATSGGYMMACVANYIIATPFSIIGSIGVVAQFPNIHKFLKKNNIDVELHTAGVHKRTLTIFGENTPEDRKKFVEELNVAHDLFKKFVKTMRPSLNIEKLSNGECWFGSIALKKKLVDDINTSDDFIISRIRKFNILHVKFKYNESIIKALFYKKLKTINNLIYKYLNNKLF
ncbi:putative protease SohB [Buchnera aphidicola str. Bp (Baizongia pistaciae)]|uniref:Putative protease SohB n=1 Tax=Buchnera aphidicola subsp. Baizongia pistaciae (strain Bp) TaxID=224915 RepID=SOHB_BUCBP|nr:protease SohB [Buchnera aphidicola]Q89AL0.1 RecName: Full=Putative protease SohB [Buchnera aphidicola str. Bp (Baizongia pistaciae)]AAO26989.1 putative protease SohB [Buchnera aphidicola str. Bp (Baizongia pistaciae)]